MIPHDYVIALAGATFVIGLLGCLRRRGHLVLIMLSGVMATLACVVLIVAAQAYSHAQGIASGPFGSPPYWALSVVLAVAAQAGVAGGLMICVYRRRGALALRRINAPRG